FLTATISTFYFASEAPPGSGREKGFLLLSGVSCGLAFLTKGFLAFALPVLVLGPYLVWQRRWVDLFRMGRLPILIAVLAALPWCIIIHLREPDFWRFFIWNEHIRRFMEDGAQHKESFWFFFRAAPGLFMPWTFLIPAAAAGIMEQFHDRGLKVRLIRFSICWLVLPFLFFSASNGKLFTYILPCFPPFAILMAFGISHGLNKGKKRFFQWGVAGTGMLFGLVLLALVYVQLFGYHGFRPYSQPWKAIMAVNSLVFFILFCFWAFRNREGMKKVLLFALSPFLFFFIAHFIIPDLTVEKKAPGILLERYGQNIGHDTIIISDENTITAVCWYLHRSDVYLLEGDGELDYGLSYEDASGRLIDIKSAVGLIKGNRGKTALIARVKNISRWRDQLPRPVFQDESVPEGYVLWRY
ncbi:MAG: phospholipid carrier-dependent glycosyltransferase, partial [Syntrophaceae bacterium]|nr:phospholipid carrier-dependent glycosyltransferase [Syntrophaceae bacterium]